MKKISEIIIGKRFRKDIGDLTSLKESIQEIGLLQPIVIDEDNNLIAGLRRIRAFQELGKTDIPANVVSIGNVLRGELDENVQRKNFTPSECVAIWEAMESYQGLQGNLPRSEQRRDKASKVTGMGTRTLSKAKQADMLKFRARSCTKVLLPLANSLTPSSSLILFPKLQYPSTKAHLLVKTASVIIALHSVISA